MYIFNVLRWFGSHHWPCVWKAAGVLLLQVQAQNEWTAWWGTWSQCLWTGFSVSEVDSQSLRFDWMWFCGVLSTWCRGSRTTSASPSGGRRAAGSGSCISSEFLSACFGVFTLLFGATWKKPTESLGLTVKFRPLILAVVTLTFFHGSQAEELTRSQLCVCVTKSLTFLPISEPGALDLLVHVSCSLSPGLHFLVCTSWIVLPGFQLVVCVSILRNVHLS